MEKAIRRDVHKMHAFVRFRKIDGVADEHGTITGERYVAWFEPAHEIVLRAAPFFVRRFPSMAWSIFTPDRSVHWDRETMTVSDGVPRGAVVADDALESLWRTYYASIFNPARVKVSAMRAEMPKKYWANLPEASLIPQLLSDAPMRVRRFAVGVPRPTRHREKRERELEHGAGPNGALDDDVATHPPSEISTDRQP